MIAKYLETFFRHTLLLLLPPVLIPLIVGPIALLTTPVFYETWAGIWVERPAYLAYSDDSANFLTPAQNQSERLGEALRTRAFLLDVANRTSLAPLVGTLKGEERVRKIVEDGLSAFTSGKHLLVLRFRAETPQLSFELNNALVEAFKDRATADRTRQAGAAISFYQARLQAAEEAYAQANEAMRRYVAANPRLTAIDPNRDLANTPASRLGLPLVATEPQLAELVQRVTLTQSDLERARAALEQAGLNASSSLEGQELVFQVVDPPQVPTTAIRERRKRLIFPAAGLLVGLGLSAILLVLLMATDRAVRSEADLGPGARVLGAVPRLQLAPSAQAAGPDVARRAIGFVAGATPPTPGGTYAEPTVNSPQSKGG
ncbi:MAG: hypothetical protein HY690_18390 [Chloroflexi bacterium]|nr:hypothetical protein [Chloroflexota bacterium]